ncbi:MAG: universal stress protein [Rhodoferax sp.]|nr:universal stress protein [Rhodoferax sp.]OIP19761.1 MAG: universal stress protein UspA [Comamonadaceae bacterium CG2_30_60_41]PIW07368.1 MAG: universal stress protein UspA [Comamonadaceae bacterium CG17_big_fil_post_rev_8_21_14_2_50_60_13]PIY26339.1 MAG: universal stress protein UspA [Comamonadaceae bacterium CG_4_10_14_3_um_filter_60_75]PJC12563.1 MAG: universal stress protein UspA [Comamonadaceae bacterium CG_4_9_14_0_8_um_filter_60_18]
MKILLPFDGSAAAVAAVQLAVKLVDEGLDATVVLANVQEPASLYELMVAHDPRVIEQASAAAGSHTLQVAQALLEDAGIAYESEVANGDPANTLLELLENYGCDMVVMGASGTSTLRSALLGSVSNELLHAAGVPVMIVKAPEQDSTEGV